MAVRGRPFQPGNKVGCGRPKGSRNKKALALGEMHAENGKAIVAKTMVMALQGDRVALRLCLERLLPSPKHGLVQLKLPTTATAADVSRAAQKVVEAVAGGEITPAD